MELLKLFFLAIWQRLIIKKSFSDTLKFIKDYKEIVNLIDTKLHVDKKCRNDKTNGSEKYFNTKYWTIVNLNRVYDLKLNNSEKPKKILDLGTGFGYFPFICEYFGHTAVGLDLDTSVLYNEATRALGVNRKIEKIIAYEPLHISEKFDYVVAYMICFNNHHRKNVWGKKEWSYFLDDIRQRLLEPNGVIYLSLNAESKELPIETELLDYFKSIGDVNDTNVKIVADR